MLFQIFLIISYFQFTPMDKIRGEQKRLSLKKDRIEYDNRYCTDPTLHTKVKKSKYTDLHISSNFNGVIRTKFREKVNKLCTSNEEDCNEFILPQHTPKTTKSWWDCGVYKGRVF